MPMDSSNPIEAVPACGENIRLSNLQIVVRDANHAVRAVLVCNGFPALFDEDMAETRRPATEDDID